MEDQKRDAEEGPGEPERALRAPPEAQPVLPGIPEPEPAEGPAPVPIPVGEPEKDTDEERGPSKVLELESRLDRRMEAGLDRGLEKETEERLEGEIDQGIERKLQQDLELQIDSEIGRQMGPPTAPRVVDLGARQVPGAGEEIPYAAVLPATGQGAAPPPGPEPEPPARKKLHRRPALRNRQTSEKALVGDGRDLNGRPAGLVNGRGLRNRRGFSNGMVNGDGAVNGLPGRTGPSGGAVNGRGAVNGLRNRRGMSNGNGITNGNGMVNGHRNGRLGRPSRVNGSLTDAEGSRNGRGMVNGRGIVNGEGITNGRRLAIGESPPRPRRSALRVITAAVVAVMVIVVGLYFLLVSTEKGIHVDGAFSDWAGVSKNQDDLADQANPEINIVACALAVDGSSASVYLKTEGRMMGGRENGVDSVFFFFDTDEDTATGYRIDSVGAELVLIADGYDGRVSAAGLYRFPRDGARPANDWNSRTATGACRAVAAVSELEAQTALADLGVGAGSKFNVLAYTRDGSGGEDFAPVMSTEKVRLTAFWSRVGPARADPGSSGVPLLTVELRSSGGNASVSSISVHASGALADGDLSRLSMQTAAGYDLPGATGVLSGGRATLSIFPPLSVAPGSTATVTVLGTFSTAAATGKAVGLSIEDGRDIAGGTRAITVEARALPLTYIGAASARITVDGAFLDWTAYPEHPDPTGDTADPNIDVTGFKAASDDGSLFLYLRVDGDMMGGMGIPERKLRPPPQQQGGGVGPVSLPVLVGEDAAFVFVDSDNDSATGYSGGGIPLGADYMANLTGQHGRINYQRLHRFTGSDRGAWSWGAAGEVQAAAAGTQLEARLSLGDLGAPSGNLSLFYYTTNWKLDRDRGERVAFDLSAGTGGRAEGGDGRPYDGPEPPVSGRDIQPLHAPEFRDVLFPVAGMLVVFIVFRRRIRGARG